MKKKRVKKKRCRKLGWATAHLQFVLGHDITNCIVTQSAHGQARHGHDTVGHGHDTAQLGCDTASPRLQHDPAPATWGFVS